VSRLTDLIAEAKVKDPQLSADLEREFRALSSRLPFGLNFERHQPEAVELPRRPIRKGDKVRVLPERGSTKRGDQRLWQVVAIDKKGTKRVADLRLLNAEQPEARSVALEDVVVVAAFKDTIYPGLVSTGKVERGADSPYHIVINAENYHALKALTWSHRGKIDAIYIDPPYNTGAKDWKYNNDYIEGDDLYRHSKWLAFMERRLLLAKELLQPEDSVLIVTIDEKEYLRLGLLLEQIFGDANMQMVTTMISPQGVARPGAFSRVNEFIYFLRFGAAAVQRTGDDMLIEVDEAVDAPVWFSMIRSGTNARREDSKNGFYPIFVDPATRRIVDVGDSLPLGLPRSTVIDRAGLETVWPIRRDLSEGNWQLTPPTLRTSIEEGFIRVGERNPAGNLAIMYIRAGDRARLRKRDIVETGADAWGYRTFERVGSATTSRMPKSMWNRLSHDAGKQGSMLTSSILGGRKFPFPKSLYAVEDSLRFFIVNKPNAIVLDFFAGSGTTAHAVMRLNRQDGGCRQCISVTNNEVAAEEHAELRTKGLRPGDLEWEQWGICDYITKPRIAAAITGITPDGAPIKGDYKFTDEFPISDGFAESAEFFTLTYESPVAISYNVAFARIAPLLWIRAGSRGRRIEKIPDTGWAVVEAYGLLTDPDQATPFLEAVRNAKDLRIAFIVTDDDRRFQAVARRLPNDAEPVRLYESYLTNFAFAIGEEE
jgi:adenine-specific DNA-methyltransferase